MARARLTIAGETGVALLLLFLMIVLYLWADGARRDALEAQRAAELRTLETQQQLECQNGLQAEWAGALLAYIVALNSGDGAAVALFDAQQATAEWQEAQQNCATR